MASSYQTEPLVVYLMTVKGGSGIRAGLITRRVRQLPKAPSGREAPKF